MTRETVTALRNYDWLVRHRGLDDVALAWDSDTLVYGDGDGAGSIEELTRPGFTPATEATPASSRERSASPHGAQEIAAHARQHVQCQPCSAEPGSPCAGSDRIVCKSRYIAAAIALKRQAKAAWQAPEQAAERAAILARLPRVSPEEIEACRTPAGGYSFTREQLAAWGVPWPPPAGWRQALVRGEDGSDDR